MKRITVIAHVKGTLVLAGLLAAAMTALVVTLATGHGDGRGAIDRYLAAVKADAGAAPDPIRDSTGFSVSNFQSQHDTSCFWVTLHGPRGDTEAQFVLSGNTVIAVSLTRECDCPEDFEQPCQLK